MTHVRMRALLKSCAPLLVAATASAPAQAIAGSAMAEESRLSSLQFYERTSEGRSIGCELIFRTVGVDTYYRTPPGPVILSGSLFFYPEGAYAEGLKVCGIDVGDRNEQFTISYAYPIVYGKSYAKVEHNSRASDKCHLAAYTPVNKLMSGLSFDFSSMKLAYTRMHGGQDVIIDLKWGDSRVEAVETQKRYDECVLRLLEAQE